MLDILAKYLLFTSNFNMKSFIRKIFLFFTPLFIFFLFPVWVLFESGEFISTEKMISLETSNQKVLFGKAYIPLESNFLVQSIERKKPDVIALGNSRVLQIRKEFFRDNVSFFNAGGSILHSGDLEWFVSQLSVKPKIIFLGLEQSFFHPMWTEKTMISNRLRSEKMNFEQFLGIGKKVYIDFVKGKIPVSFLFQNESSFVTVGMNARIHQNGLRSDGSYFYGEIIRNPQNPKLEDAGFRETFNRIEKGERRFEYADSLSEEGIQKLETFFAFCKQNNIQVVGFFPPYAPSVWNRMTSMNNGKNYAYIKLLMPTVNPLFMKYGFPLFDFSDVSSWSKDSEFIDGFHGGEKLYAKMMLHMASSTPLLDSVFDRNTVKNKTDETSLDLAIFE